MRQLELGSGRPESVPKHWVRRTLRYFVPHARGLIAAFLLLILSSALTLGGPLLLQRAIDYNVARQDRNGLLVTSGLYLLFQIALVTVTWSYQRLVNVIANGAMAALTIDFFGRLTGQPVTTFEANRSGSLISRVMGDVNELNTFST